MFRQRHHPHSVYKTHRMTTVRSELPGDDAKSTAFKGSGIFGAIAKVCACWLFKQWMHCYPHRSIHPHFTALARLLLARRPCDVHRETVADVDVFTPLTFLGRLISRRVVQRMHAAVLL